MHDYFRGNPEGKSPFEFLRDREPIRPEYRDHDARLATMDEFGLEWIWMFPTLGVLYEELLKHDVEAVTITFTSFNRWLDEDWGCNYREPALRRALHLAVRRRLGGERARVGAVARRPRRRHASRRADDHVRPPLPRRRDVRPVLGARRTRPASPSSSTPATAGTRRRATRPTGSAPAFDPKGAARPSIRMFAIERAAYDFLLSIIFDDLFTRFPNVRVASVENGSEFLPDLFRKLASVPTQDAGLLPRRPGRHLPRARLDQPVLGGRSRTRSPSSWATDRVIFGSDWPHIEGMPPPARLRGRAQGVRRRRAPAHPPRQRARADRAAPRPGLGSRSPSLVRRPARARPASRPRPTPRPRRP